MHPTYFKIFIMKQFLILAFIPILFSCNKKEEFGNTYHFSFFPRLVSYIWSDYSIVLSAIEDDKGNMTYYAAQDFSGSEAKSDQFVLGLYTSNLNIDTVAFEILVKDDFVGRNELLSIWDLNSLTHYKPIRFLQEDFIKTNYVDEQEISVEEKIVEFLKTGVFSAKMIVDSLKIDWTSREVSTFLKNRDDVLTVKGNPLKFAHKDRSIQKQKTLFD